MQPPRVALVVNANARRFAESPAQIDHVVALAAGRATVHVTRSRAELAEVAAHAVAAGVDVVVLCSGDGGYGAGVGAFVEAAASRSVPTPRFALAPGGTVCTVARAIGARTTGSTGEGIARALHAACLASPKVRPLATLSIERDDAARALAFVFGTGLVARFFEMYEHEGTTDGARARDVDRPSSGAGLIAAGGIVAKIFAQSFVGGPLARQILDPMPCSISIDGASLPWTGASLLIAATIADLGLGMRVTYRAGESLDGFHVVASALGPTTLGPRALRVLRGRSIGDPGEPHVDTWAQRLEVSFADVPGGRGAFVIDGDLRTGVRAVVSAGPTVEVLIPG